MSNLIPDTSKESSNAEYSDKNDQVLTKKRRSFIPVESNLKEGVVSETKHKRAEGIVEPKTEKNEQSGDAPSVTSGDSEDSNNEKASEKTEEPEESEESGRAYCWMHFLLKKKHLYLTRVTLNSEITDKPVALGFQIELEFGNVGF